MRRERWAIAVFLGASLLMTAAPFWIARHAPAPLDVPPSTGERLASGRIGRNGSLHVSLAGLGVPRLELAAIDGALARVFNPRRARPSDAYEVKLSTAGGIRN